MHRNYIFDFYGTLVDIHTDENQRLLWHDLTNLYARYGADYPQGELRKTYNDLCRKEKKSLQERLHCPYPEIDLYRVFYALYEQAPAHHRAELVFDEGTPRLVGAVFRTLATRRFHVFDGTKETLKKLKALGCGVYLLSNAQHVFTQAELEMTGLLPLFDAAYISSDAGIKKPDPAFMNRLLTEQHLNRSECVMVGNEIGCDLKVAAGSGTRGILLNTPTNHLTRDEISAGLRPLLLAYPDFSWSVIGDGKIERLPKVEGLY